VPCMMRMVYNTEAIMPLDPRAKAFLEQMAAATGPAVPVPTPDNIEDLRLASNLMVREWAGSGPAVAKVEDRLVRGPECQIPIRIYTPRGKGPLPVLVYFHGGGFWMGSLETEDSTCRLLANAVGCTVVSVEYRLAPEHKFPAAAEDCYAATRWVAENADAVRGDRSRIAVSGASAGGNMAAVVALMARDRGTPRLIYQLLMYPVTNYAFDTPSYQENAEGYMLTKDIMMWCWSLYLRTEADGLNPYASPLRAKNLSGLPPSMVITAEYDPLRDEGEAYAARVRQAGVPVVCKRQAGAIHGGLPPAMAQEMTGEAIADLRSAFFLEKGHEDDEVC